MNIAIILIEAAIFLALASRLLLKSINQLMELSFHKGIESLVKCNVRGVSAKKIQIATYFQNL